MDTVLAGLKWQTCLVYLDDVVVFARTFEDHIERLKQVLEAIRTVGLTLKPQKCRFGYEELKFLGHVVNCDGVRPDPEKTAAIANYPVPSNVKDVRSFLGLCAYYRRFIPSFSKIASPLNALTKGGAPFQWHETQQQAFDELRARLQTAPVLAYFDRMPKRRYTPPQGTRISVLYWFNSKTASNASSLMPAERYQRPRRITRQQKRSALHLCGPSRSYVPTCTGDHSKW